MKPIIGIITRKSISEEGNNINIIYNDIVNVLIKNNSIPLGLSLCSNYKEMIDLCDGIIFQGGDNFEEYDLDSLKYIYEIDKPVLGICLGMQLMGVLFDGILMDSKNHKKKLEYAHSVRIEETSKLYDIFKISYIKVNSRHKSVIKNTKLKITGLSNDGYIEAVESPTKKFFIGVQWHPENMIDYDNKQENIFKKFIEICEKNN